MTRGSGKWLIAVTLLFIVADLAAAREEIDVAPIDNQIEVKTTPVTESGGRARLFEVAIVTVSLGAMGAAASLHFLHAERKKLTNTIAKLDRFIAGTCCISVSVQEQTDVEPIIDEIRKTEEEKGKELRTIDLQEEQLLRRYSEVETQLTRIVGRG